MFIVLCAFDAWFGHIDLELVVSHGIVVEHADRLIGLSLGGHGYKGEALRHAGALIYGDIHRGDGSGLCEQGLDFILRGRLVQVSYINSNIHFVAAFYPKGHISGRSGNKNDREPYKWVGGQSYDEDPIILT